MGSFCPKPVPPPVPPPAPAPLSLPGGIALQAKITTRDPMHASYRAVSLDWLVSFCQKYPDIGAKQMTAKQVVTDVIMPATKDCKTSYVDMILNSAVGGQECVSRGRAFVYITYSWSKPFAAMVDELRKHFPGTASGKVPVFVWIDVLADSQYGDTSPELARVLQLHMELIEDSDYTMLVMDLEGAALDYLTLFMYDSFSGKWVPPPGRRVEQLNNGVCELKIRGGERLAQQWKHCTASIDDSAGGDTAGDQDEGPMDKSKLEEYDQAALMLQAFGRYGQAVKFVERALTIRSLTLGKSHPDTLTTCVVLAGLFDKLGRGKEAADLRRDALRPSVTRSGGRGGDDPSNLCNVVSGFDDLMHHQNKVDHEKKKLGKMIGKQVKAVESTDKPRAKVLQTLAAAIDDKKRVQKSQPGPCPASQSGFIGLQLLAGLGEKNRRILASRGHPDV